MNKDIQSNYFLDSASAVRMADYFMDFGRAQEIAKKHQTGKFESTLFSKGKRTNFFFTEDSKLYITPKESRIEKMGIVLDRDVKKWDSLSSRIVKNFVKHNPSRGNALCRLLLKKYASLNEEISLQSKHFASHFSIVKAWNISIVAAILFGMLTMTMIYRYLGQGAAAKGGIDNLAAESSEIETARLSTGIPQVLGDEVAINGKTESAQDEARGLEYIEQVIQDLDGGEKEALEKKMIEMVKGHPIEKMIPYIVEKDRIVAAFLIGIAKKESNWGERVPVLNGQDCYNYWGYRGQRRLMGSGGHTCFNSRKDAVDTVAKRIEWLVNNNKLNTPEKMVIWKCGSSCAGHSNYSVQKWISDVNMYFKKLND